MGSTEATASCTPSLPHAAVTVEATTSLSLYLSHTVIVHTRYITYLQMCNNNFTFALSHIYTHMTFRLFTLMAPKGPTRTHLHMCLLPIGREDHHRALDHPVLLYFPSGGTCFPTLLK